MNERRKSDRRDSGIASKRVFRDSVRVEGCRGTSFKFSRSDGNEEEIESHRSMREMAVAKKVATEEVNRDRRADACRDKDVMHLV